MRFSKVFLIGLLFLTVAQVNGQQEPNYVHFRFNKPLLNPATAGLSGRWCINAVSHQQWLSFKDETPLRKTASDMPIGQAVSGVNPRANGFGISAPINYKNKNLGGVYIGLVDDKVGYELNTYMKFGLAYNLELNPDAGLRIGVEAMSLNKRLDGTKLRYHDPNDPLIPTLNQGDQKTLFNGGLYYYNNYLDDLFVGFSVSQINKAQFYFQTQGGGVNVQSAKHFYIMSGITRENWLGNPALTFQPSILLKTVNDIKGFVKPSIDLQGIVTWNKLYCGGLSWRSDKIVLGGDALSFMIGYYPPFLKGNDPDENSKNTLRIGYSYDLTLSSWRPTQTGTHEIQVNYCFKIKLPPPPRKEWKHPLRMTRDRNLEEKNIEPTK